MRHRRWTGAAVVTSGGLALPIAMLAVGLGGGAAGLKEFGEHRSALGGSTVDLIRIERRAAAAKRWAEEREAERIQAEAAAAARTDRAGRHSRR